MTIKRCIIITFIVAISALFMASSAQSGKIFDNFEKGKIEGWEIVGYH